MAIAIKGIFRGLKIIAQIFSNSNGTRQDFFKKILCFLMKHVLSTFSKKKIFDKHKLWIFLTSFFSWMYTGEQILQQH